MLGDLAHLSEVLLGSVLLLLLVLRLHIGNLVHLLLHLLHILLRLLFPIITSSHRHFRRRKLLLDLVSLLHLADLLRNLLLNLLLLDLERNLTGNLMETLGRLWLVLRQGLLLIVTGFHWVAVSWGECRLRRGLVLVLRLVGWYEGLKLDYGVRKVY